MDQLAESAHALKIYQDLTERLYQVLRQLETDRNEMQSKITQLENQLRTKDQIIKNLEQKLQLQTSKCQLKQNLVKVFADIQSEPFLGHKKQTSTTTQSNSPKSCKIDINSYFKDLVSQINTKSFDNKNQSKQTPAEKVQNLIKHCQSRYEPEQITSFNFLSCQKIIPKDSKLQTRVQTSQSNSKETQENSSNKENVQLIHPNVSPNFSICFQLQLDLQNIGKKKDQTKFNDKQILQRQNQNTLNVSNFFSKNIKTRKPSFRTTKYQTDN